MKNSRLFSDALRRAGMASSGGFRHKDIKSINVPAIPPIQAFEARVRSTEESKMMHLRNMRPFPVPLPKPLEKTPYVAPRSVELDTPNWFRKNDEQVDVSVIIPLFRSTEVVRKLIDSWDFGGPSAEVIFVSDACPNQSHSVIVPTFAERTAHQVGRVYAHSHQSGFAAACNTGAANSRGTTLVFLNADTEVTPGWLEPLIKPLEDRSVGIVGNLQLKMDGSIDSAGSEWTTRTRSFEHIGRNIYKGNRLHKPMRPEAAPEDVLADGERQMVTGCCVALRKDFYISIGGFDEKYRIGYWEDSDLCMRVLETGKKVYFTSKSVIKHKGSHSGSSGHPFMKDNARLFYSRWIDNGKFEKFRPK